MTRSGFHCMFDYDFYDYSDYDYNDYTFPIDSTTQEVATASPGSSVLAETDATSSVAKTEELQGGIITPSLSDEGCYSSCTEGQGYEPDRVCDRYGCSDYLSDDAEDNAVAEKSPAATIAGQASKTAERNTPDAAYEWVECGYGEFGYDLYSCELEAYDEQTAAKRDTKLTEPASPADEDLLSGHDAVYDAAVYGVTATMVEQPEVDGYYTFYFGVPSYETTYIDRCFGSTSPKVGQPRGLTPTTEYDPETLSIVRTFAERMGRFTQSLVAEIIANRRLATATVEVACRVFDHERPAAAPALHQPNWGHDDCFSVTLGTEAIGSGIGQSSNAAAAGRQLLLEAADTLEGAGAALTTAAEQLRDMASSNKVSWRGVPYRR